MYCPVCHRRLNVIPESNRFTHGKPRFKTKMTFFHLSTTVGHYALAIMMFLPFTPENTSGRMLFRFTLKTPVLSYISRKDVTLIIPGSVTADSKKSLSPVRNKSACAFNAALKIGQSLGSRISFSRTSSSSGVCTVRIDRNA